MTRTGSEVPKDGRRLMCGAARWTGARELSREWWFCSANITQPTAANRRCSKLEVAPSYRSTVTHPLLYEQEYVMKSFIQKFDSEVL